MGKLKSGDLLISGKRDSCGRREILIKSYNFMCCIYMFDSLMVRFRDGCGSICLFFVQNHRNGQYEKEEKQRRNKKRKEVKDEKSVTRGTAECSINPMPCCAPTEILPGDDEE